MELDHIAVSAATLAEGVAHVEAALGVRLGVAIGNHALMATHNRLLGLGPVGWLWYPGSNYDYSLQHEKDQCTFCRRVFNRFFTAVFLFVKFGILCF